MNEFAKIHYYFVVIFENNVRKIIGIEKIHISYEEILISEGEEKFKTLGAGTGTTFGAIIS